MRPNSQHLCPVTRSFCF